MYFILRALWYLPIIIKVGHQVLDLVEEIDKMRNASEALKYAKTGDPEPLKELVNKL